MGKDLRYAFRTLVKSPAFTAVAALSLALGIGANTAMFSLVNAALFKPIPVAEPDRLAAIFMTDERNPGNLPLSHLNFKDLRDGTDAFTGMAAFSFAQVNWAAGRESQQIPAQVVSANYFSVLGVPPALGRGFLPEEETQQSPVAVVSHGFWERSLGADPGAVGGTITLNRTPFTVVGVAPRGFTGTLLGDGPSVWLPMAMHAVAQPGFAWYEQRRGLFLFAVGRLAPGVPLEQAGAQVRSRFAQLERAYPDENRGRGAIAVSLLDARLNPQGQGGVPLVQVSVILMAVVGTVLLIACANIANLLLARAGARRREIAVRLALGANRRRLLRQLLTESTVLGALGAGLGLILAYWLLDLLIGTTLPVPFPIEENLALDPRVLAFTGGLAVATGLLFGLAPALQASRADVVPVLKNESAPAGHGRSSAGARLRHVLVVSQIALSVVALVAAGLFVRSLQTAQRIDTGFETSGVLVMNLNLGREGYTAERGQVFYEQLIERVSRLPGVRHAAIAQNAPFDGGILRSVTPEGADTTTADRILVQVNAVTPEFFEALDIPLRAGRAFSAADRENTPQIAVVNETMAARFWPGEDPVGRRFKFFGDETLTTIVGVAADAKYNAVAEDPTPFIYRPMRQAYSPAATLHVRAAGTAAAAAGPVRQEIQQLDATLSVFNVRTLEDQVALSLAPLRANAVLLAAFGLLAMLLASIGLYGVASYAVSQRTREIGVRMALGARPGSVLRLVLSQALLLIGAGLAAGLVLAFAVAALIPPDLLPAVSPRDPVTYTATAALLAVVALAASYIPARRATRVDPVLALRTD